MAFAAHQRNIKYWGLTFNERHQCLLRERLDMLCLPCMLEEGHPLYDPVAFAAVKAGAPQPKKPAPKPKVSPKPKKNDTQAESRRGARGSAAGPAGGGRGDGRPLWRRA